MVGERGWGRGCWRLRSGACVDQTSMQTQACDMRKPQQCEGLSCGDPHWPGCALLLQIAAAEERLVEIRERIKSATAEAGALKQAEAAVRKEQAEVIKQAEKAEKQVG